MKKFLVLAILMAFGFSALNAKDRFFNHNINEALNSEFAKKMLDNSVNFEFSKTYDIDEKPLVLSKSSNKYRKKFDSKTKGLKIIDKDYKTSCQYVFITTLREFESEAKVRGAKSVVNLQGFFQNQTFDSKDEFQCIIGNMITRVILKGNFK
ncbi:excinuclease ATPase subunit [Campylobacter sp. FMV-PI01]|uniref:Excinuclease ATPase subunit n=1 Tax=Campylobacter portucalensis TaxID=2608384 RepID=A0A6L5WLL9_9BACT|nr:excinuclease ATPase subunit [Campylobacter portucalensis]MSN96703.1 excinuclease ATPase subunit [Campylobacter portucalensis]